MIKFIQLVKTLVAIISLLLATGLSVWGQTNPVPQSLPYAQNFDGLLHSSTTYPAGWQGWTIAASEPGSSFNVASPIADRLLVANSSASTTSGNVHNYNGKIGFLNTGSLDLSIVFAVSTVGQKDIQVAYDIMTIRNPHNGTTNTRINEVTLQYRVGTTGLFTNLTGIEYQNNTTTQTTSGVTTPQNLVSRSITLPAAVNNQPVVQLRWAAREITGGGSRPSFAVDNISVTGIAGEFVPPVASFTPADGTTEVPINNIPLISFDEVVFTSTGVAVDNSNVASLISLRENDATGAVVPFTATITNGRDITVVPATPLKNNQIYYLAVAPVRDTYGNTSAIQSATFTTINNDATLSVFTIGGVNGLQLDSVLVDNPTARRGAFMDVDSFATLMGGIVATPNDSKAQIIVRVNDNVVTAAQLPALIFDRGDIVLVTVTAEDGITTKFYKVSLWEEIPFITVISPPDGASFFVMQSLNLAWQTNAIGQLGLRVAFPDDSLHIVDVLEASAALVSVPIPNGIPTGNYQLTLVWMEYPIVTSQKLNFVLTDNLKPSLINTTPRNGSVNVPVDQVLMLDFDEDVFAANGNIYIMSVLDHSVFDTVPITGSEIVIIDNKLEITLPVPLEPAVEYYIITDPGIVRDINGLEFDGVLDSTAFRWTTAGLYDITVVVTDGTNPLENALVVLHSNPQRQLSTNAQGVGIFENVPYGNYGLSINGTWWGSIEADRDKTIQVIKIPSGAITHEVRFDVTHNGQPFSGARVVLTGYGTLWTDAAGIANFERVLPSDSIHFSVDKWDIQTVEGTVAVSVQNVVVQVVVRKLQVVPFVVTDIDGEVGGAKVEFDNRIIFTNNAGFAIFWDVPEGSGKVYTISKPGYVTYAGTLDVSDWNRVLVLLEKAKVAVTFTVLHSSNPISGAEISIAGHPVITTNAQGVATIELFPGQYTYSVSAAGFVGTSGTPFTVANDPVSVEVLVRGLNVISPESVNNLVTVYPNPTYGIFTVQIQGATGQSISVELLDITGRLLYSNDYAVANGTLQETINVTTLEAGTYILRINDAGNIVTRKIIVR